MANIKVSFENFLHTHPLIELYRLGIVSVHIQTHLARLGMKFLDAIDGLLEQQFAQLLSLEGGEDVNLL